MHRPTDSSLRSPGRGRGARLLALLALLAAGCDDPFCFFSGDCSEGAGSSIPVGESPAAFPSEGSWILPAPPEVVGIAAGGHPETAVAVFFSESMAPASLEDAFVLAPADGTPLAIVEPPPLVGDGRVALLVPLAPLVAGQGYVVRAATSAQATDLTGQALAPPIFGDYGSFVLDATATATPELVATWPLDGDTGQSDLTEIVAVFDRPMDGTTFGTASWQVTVGDAPPTFHPAPEAVVAPDGTTIAQVWRWRSVDTTGRAVSLGVDEEVALDLSPVGDELLDRDGDALPATSVVFELGALRVPAAVAKHPDAAGLPDAIGAAELLGTDPVVRVTFSEALEVGDRVRIYLTGATSNTDSALVTLLRTVTLDVVATEVDLTPAHLSLLSSSAPPVGRLGDGTTAVAVAVERDGAPTAVRLFDGDPVTAAIELPRFDVTPPVVLGFGTEGSDSVSFVSDQRDLVLVGRADEELGQVEVTAAGMQNWTPPEIANVVGADPGGLFVGRPVRLGTSAPAAVAFDVRALDRAGNAAVPFTATFEQRGYVGPRLGTAGDPFDVDVFDARTLAPLAGARVFVHEGTAGALVSQDVTGPSGHAAPNSAAVGETVVTVDLPGYDLASFQGEPRQLVQFLLWPSGLADAAASGSVVGPDADGVASWDARVGDARRADALEPAFAVEPCAQSGADFDCPFGPVPIRPARLGAQTFLGVDASLGSADFTADGFLLAFALRLPAAPVAPGATEEATLAIPGLLTGLDPGEAATAIDPKSLTRASAPGLGMLDGGPTITIQARAPGLPGPLVVGRGLALDYTGVTWSVMGAIPGAVDGLPPSPERRDLVARGTLEPDLRLDAQLVDVAGHRVGVRPELASAPSSLEPLDVPALLAPVGASGAPPYFLGVRNVVLDGFTGSGIYRVVLASGGRRWTLWRPDVASGLGNPRFLVPDLAPGGQGLPNGAVEARVSAFAMPSWPSATAPFLWSDVARDCDRYGHAAATTYSQP